MSTAPTAPEAPEAPEADASFPAILEPRALTVGEAAHLLKVKPGEIRTMIRSGRIKATKLNVEAAPTASTWRIPRSSLDEWLGPWDPKYADPPPEPRPVGRPRKNHDHEPGTGMTREALRAHAGLAAEAGPSQSYPAPDAVSDSPSGTVKPHHHEERHETVVLQGVTRYASHPSEPLSGTERTVRAQHEINGTATREAPPQLEYDGREAPPTDGSTWGAGPAGDPPPADDDVIAVPADDEVTADA